jgi:hypothetical protein
MHGGEWWMAFANRVLFQGNSRRNLNLRSVDKKSAGLLFFRRGARHLFLNTDHRNTMVGVNV